MHGYGIGYSSCVPESSFHFEHDDTYSHMHHWDFARLQSLCFHVSVLRYRPSTARDALVRVSRRSIRHVTSWNRDYVSQCYPMRIQHLEYTPGALLVHYVRYCSCFNSASPRQRHCCFEPRALLHWIPNLLPLALCGNPTSDSRCCEHDSVFGNHCIWLNVAVN